MYTKAPLSQWPNSAWVYEKNPGISDVPRLARNSHHWAGVMGAINPLTSATRDKALTCLYYKRYLEKSIPTGKCTANSPWMTYWLLVCSVINNGRVRGDTILSMEDDIFGIRLHRIASRYFVFCPGTSTLSNADPVYMSHSSSRRFYSYNLIRFTSAVDTDV